MKHCLLIGLLLCVAFLQAQPPVGYYNNASQKKGYALRQALFNIVKTHTELSYSALWNAFRTTDVRPDNSKVWDIYSDNPTGQTSYYYVFGTNQCGNYNSEGDCYNREHSVPQSWFGEATPMKTDLFHIYPTDGFVNGKRNNFAFGEVGNASWTSTNGSKLGSCATSGYSGTVFEPNDAYKGDLARSYFYMAVCYMDKNLNQDNYSMFSGGSLKPWALDMLIRWHNEDPVSQKEIDRNNAVYSLQHNRNPFIDFPELVGKIWGGDSVNAFYPNGIAEISIAEKWHVYPVPATDRVTIVAPAAIEDPVTVQIVSLTGQVLWSEEENLQSSLTLILPDIPSGIYLLQIIGNDFICNKKMVKRK
ncbi:MAG: endonuclease [Bacteroidales bacterium]|nr:endonuclease [Bacteroidales bacterium]